MQWPTSIEPGQLVHCFLLLNTRHVQTDDFHILPDDKILAEFKLKALADENIKVAQTL